MLRSTRVWMSAVVVLAVGVLVHRHYRAGAQAGRPSILRACVLQSGSSSAIAQARYIRISDQADWSELWQAHMGKEQEKDSRGGTVAPTMYFDDNMVIAAFRGREYNNRRVELVEVRDLGDHVGVRLRTETYQTTGRSGGGQVTTAYGMFVMPRSGRPLVIEEDEPTQLGSPPVWREKARFPAL